MNFKLNPCDWLLDNPYARFDAAFDHFLYDEDLPARIEQVWRIFQKKSPNLVIL
jgi:hypothetical protein